MQFPATHIAVLLGIASSACLLAQNRTAPDSTPAASKVTADYPDAQAGILIQGSDWTSIVGEGPTKTRLKHSFAPALTYGIAPAAAVSDYRGLHAEVQVEPGHPVICICHLLSIPGTPVLVRLHPKKDHRELDGGKLHIGGKVAQAESNDLLDVNVTHPENNVWLVQPRQALEPGEYALMLGTQNLDIFSFSVAADSEHPTPAKQR